MIGINTLKTNLSAFVLNLFFFDFWSLKTTKATKRTMMTARPLGPVTQVVNINDKFLKEIKCATPVNI